MIVTYIAFTEFNVVLVCWAPLLDLSRLTHVHIPTDCIITTLN